ncbi:hypothetical protein AQI95_41565 [Streptomyces yokosukanensis]|uniref:Uncharacterized protein n=1 Tax=Streptomyces yokosukanensis TaxID=67386 RepID=A0A117PY84_9ACTN|nr:hypothetical protein AQI95_41565 [Streptomyces yokosukanensis]
MPSVVNADGGIESGSLNDEIVRDGARRMLAAALEAEVNQHIAELASEQDERGHRMVARDGHHRPRTVVRRWSSSPAARPGCRRPRGRG